MSRYGVNYAFLLITFSVSLAGLPSWGQEKGSGHRVEGAIESETGRLQEEVRQLEDANAMLLENLTACAEENQQLSEQLAASSAPKQVSPPQLHLIESIRSMLSVPSGLDFLSKLDEDQLQALLAAIRGRVK